MSVWGIIRNKVKKLSSSSRSRGSRASSASRDDKSMNTVCRPSRSQEEEGEAPPSPAVPRPHLKIRVLSTVVDRSLDWLRAGCPRAAEEVVVRPCQAVWDRIPHDDGTPSGHELCIHGRGMVALRRHHRTRFAPSHHGIFNKTACWNHWKRN